MTPVHILARDINFLPRRSVTCTEWNILIYRSGYLRNYDQNKFVMKVVCLEGDYPMMPNLTSHPYPSGWGGGNFKILNENSHFLLQIPIPQKFYISFQVLKSVYGQRDGAVFIAI